LFKTISGELKNEVKTNVCLTGEKTNLKLIIFLVISKHKNKQKFNQSEELEAVWKEFKTLSILLTVLAFKF